MIFTVCKRNTLKVLALAILFIFATLEWLEYSFAPLTQWPKFSDRQKDSVKLLIVGDPQLLGNKYSSPGILGHIYRWDADRYIAKTFSLAHRYVNPDLVIFLGDNLDEGENASDEEFHCYFERFRKAIIVPGDNDIGGEDEPPQPYLEKRFNKYVKDDVFMKYKFLEFVKVNYITHSNKYLVAPNASNSNYRFILSHFPMTSVYSSFISRVIPYLQPNIILSAHDHKSVHLTAERNTGIQLPYPVTDLSACSFNITDSHIHEIIVPTCSYRMGTHKMGYGALEISNNGEVEYSVLWLPSRFRQLFIYLFLIIVIFLYCFLSLTKVFLRAKAQETSCQINKQSRFNFVR